MTQDNPNQRMSRRKLLNGAGVALAGLIAPTVGIGQAADMGAEGAKDRGILEAVQSLLKQRKHNQAARLLDKHNVEYQYSAVSMPPIGAQQTKNGDVSIQSEYDKSKSTFSQFSFHNHDDVYRAHADWYLKYYDGQEDENIDSSGPVDGVGLTVSNSLWEPVLDSWDFGPNTTLKKRDRYGRGIIGGFDDPETSADFSERYQSWQHLDFRKLDSGTHNIYGTYIHSWNKYSVPGGITYGFGIGPITASVDDTTGYWRKRSDTSV